MKQLQVISASVIFLLVLFSSRTGHAQTAPADVNNSLDTIVAEVSDEKISLGDLIEYYDRNNVESDYSAGDLREFLPFYVDYKLKLVYGRDQGLFSDPDILAELQEYSKQAAFSFWLENEIKQEMADEFIERSGYELKSSHVLIQLDQNASANRLEEARQQLLEARQLFLNGDMTMEELNQQYSSSVQGRPAGGDLPWFSAGVTVKPFEDALYNLNEGDISEPVRTQFGLHLIHLEERRERTPQRNVSHIFFRGSRDDLSAEMLADSALSSLERGQPWEEVVSQFSQDGSSSNRGGNIGWVGFGTQYSADFIEAVLSVDPVAAYSQPVQTNYGYHIFRIDSVRSYGSDQQRRDELLSQLEELPRYNANRQQVLERLRNVGRFSMNDDVRESVRAFFTEADSAAISATAIPRNLARQTIATFNDQPYRVSDFKEWLNNTHQDRSTTAFSDLWFQMYEEYLLDSQVIPMTIERFPEFERETEGFLNGLVVFQVSDENIWNIETADSSALEQYYNENRGQYMFGERYDYTLLASTDDSTLTEALNMAASGVTADSISATFRNIIATRDSVAAPAEELQNVLSATETGETSDKFTYRNRDAYLIYHQLLEPRQMTFDEAFFRVGSDYQPIREENFMNKLRTDYRVRIYPERIR